jgi:very-short-patch-repair endonuclease
MARHSLSANVGFADLRTTGDLLSSGLTRGQIRSLTAQGTLVRLANGVYAWSQYLSRISAHPGGLFATKAAAALMTVAPGSVLSHHTAARLHGLAMLTDAPDLAMTHVPGAGRTVGKPGVRMYTAPLPPSHLGWRMGIPVTTPARTVVDLARLRDFREGVVIADSALARKLTSKKELTAVRAQCPRMAGIPRARLVIEFADGRAESALESIARIAFRDHGLPAPELQVKIANPDFIGRVDFLWEQYRTIAEVDGQIKYADPRRAKSQLRRDRRLREAGYEVVHFDWREITTTPADVAASIRQAFRRGARISPANRRPT